MNLCSPSMPCLHFISSSSSSFTNHRCSHLTTPTPKSQLPIRKPHFLVFLSSTHRTTQPTPTTSTTTRKPVAIYLIERLGFSEEQSLAISKKFLRLRGDPRANQVTDLISFVKADNVITFLQDENQCGLHLSHIKTVIRKHPLILAADVDKTLRPKVKLLQEMGFSTSDLAHVLSANPALYLHCDLSPAIQALRDFMGSDEQVLRVFMRLNYGTASNLASSLIPNVTMLENEYGIPRDKLVAFMTKSPLSLLRNTESLRVILVKMEDNWGITRDSTEFLRALHVFCCNSDENMDSKCQLFRNYGWSDADILSLIRTLPTCFTSSEARIKKSLEFYMNELGYDPGYMSSQPALFTYSLENRVVPRHKALVILKEKELIKADYQLISAIKLTEYQFFNKFIIPFKNVVPKLCEVYVNSEDSTEVLNIETSKNESERPVSVK